MSAGWPTHSKTWSTPFGSSSFTAAVVSSTAPASTKSVAPKVRASDSLAGLVSMATMRPAALRAAPCTAFRPMPPMPITATVSPGRTLARLRTAPIPVTTPHPTRQAALKGTSSGMTTAWFSLTTVSSENTPVFANWNAPSPPTVKGLSKRADVDRQCVGSPRSQAAQWPQLPSVVSTTWSPTATLVTASPTSSTSPAPLVAEHDRRGETGWCPRRPTRRSGRAPPHGCRRAPRRAGCRAGRRRRAPRARQSRPER